jgi:hypothetical protein
LRGSTPHRGMRPAAVAIGGKMLSRRNWQNQR